MDDKPFRDRAVERIRASLGEPAVLKVEHGLEIYRWVLHRPHGLSIYVTLDSPENPDIAHLIISDPKSGAIDPVVSISIRTTAEIDAVIARIVEQWGGRV